MECFITFAAMMLTALHAFGQPAHSLTVGEGFVDALGFHDAKPLFSWKLPDGTKWQSAHRIEAASGDKRWDSGWVESDQSTLVPYGGEPLASRQRVEWRVSFRDENGKDSGWSQTARFELGLLSARDWKAQWIRPRGESEDQREHRHQRRRAHGHQPEAEQAAQLNTNGVRGLTFENVIVNGAPVTATRPAGE